MPIYCKLPEEHQQLLKVVKVDKLVCQEPGSGNCGNCFIYWQIFNLATQDAVKKATEALQSRSQVTGETLSHRENEVIKLVAAGNSNQKIAEDLQISETTVKAHMRSILGKFHVKNRAMAAAEAVRRGLIKPEVN